MREKHWIFSDLLKRKLYLKYEIKKIILSSILKNNQIKNVYKYLAFYKKSQLIRSSSIIQQTNRCFLTGRPWYVLKHSRYSRFKFRIESNSGNLPGFRRASW